MIANQYLNVKVKRPSNVDDSLERDSFEINLQQDISKDDPLMSSMMDMTSKP